MLINAMYFVFNINFERCYIIITNKKIITVEGLGYLREI